jgi:hypothetical protein
MENYILRKKTIRDFNNFVENGPYSRCPAGVMRVLDLMVILQKIAFIVTPVIIYIQLSYCGV